MADSTLNRFLSAGTAAARAAFTPTPPTPAAGAAQGYFWHETDTGDTYSWKAGTGWIQVNSAVAASSFTSWKTAVRAATTANGTLATAFENGDTIDGVVLATGDRILIKNQSTASENGVYTVNASGAPTRATDTDTGAEMLGAIVPIMEGTVNADRIFKCTNNATISLGVTNLVFIELQDVAAAGSQGDILYRDANGWARLAAGTSGQVLRTGGSGANPAWSQQAHRGALVTKAADQTAANYTGTANVAWDSEDYDTDSIHDNVTNNTRLTVPSGVTKVRLRAQISILLANAFVIEVIAITKNGSAAYTGYATDRSDINNTDPAISTASPVLTVTAGDYFEVSLTVTVDTSITIQAQRSWFAMEIIE